MEILALIEKLVNGMQAAESDFFKDLTSFNALEQKTNDLFRETAAEWLAGILTDTDKQIQKKAYSDRYTVQRHDTRTLITITGDAVFEHTLFYDKQEKRYRYLLDELMELKSHERFSSLAEAELIRVASKTSYAEAGKKFSVSKEAVKDKVHSFNIEIPIEKSAEKKKCEYLYIEADEDHISSQDDPEGKGYLGKLVYLYESKEFIDKESKRRALKGSYYRGGLYRKRANQRLWKEMQEYICEHYDTDYLKKVYIIGDGANWIESGTEYIAKSVFVIDKFHLAEYIHKAARQMLDEADYAKECIYKFLMKRDYNGFAKIISRMKKSADNPEIVDKCSKYVSRHWSAVMRSLHDENVYGSSAEGHVSNMYSSRMSSRPMAWSADGVDGMCRLRCYISNYGESKIIDLVEYKRRLEKKELRATGTDGKVIRNQIAEASAAYVQTEYNQARSYIDRLQATIPGLTAAKAFSIRNQLNL